MDRRIIFLIMGASVAIPLLFSIDLPLQMTKPVKDFYETIEALPEGSVVFVADDWDPGSVGELRTASIVVHEHLFQRNLKVIDVCLWPTGPGIVSQTLEEVARRHNKTYGEDYVYLGFKEGRQTVMVALAESIARTFPRDFHGNKMADLPIMRGIEKVQDCALLISVSAGYPGTKEWVQQVRNRYDLDMMSATGGVSAPEYYPYYESGQLLGIVGGIKAMAEYETLIGKEAFAVRAMDAQSVGHYTLVLLIVVGNVLYLMNRRREKKAGRGI